jgi:aminopeptidase-like protein
VACNGGSQRLEPSFQADAITEDLGNEMYQLIRKLYPINRSITGAGLRETLKVVSEHIALTVSEVPSGTKVFDWQIPVEWNIRAAYIEDAQGKRILDYTDHNLHVVGYSEPVDRVMSLDELLPHLHSLPDHPHWIPFRTSYYNRTWGFCLADATLKSMQPGLYKVVIDSDLSPGSLSYGEHVIRGRSPEEILFFTHTCHPSLCNDNLTGIAVATQLAKQLSARQNRYTYRFLYAPATIGSIAWLARNEERLSTIRGGLVLTVIGDKGHMVYKKSRRGDAEIDQAAAHVLTTSPDKGEVREFSPWGYDERQFCSPGLDLPVGRLTRTPNGEYPEYHSSADSPDIVAPEYLLHSLRTVWQIIEVLECNSSYVNTSPKGEPQLGKRGLYTALGGYQDIAPAQLAMLWVLNQSDGTHTLLDIARKARLPFSLINRVSDDLIDSGLLKPDIE